MGELLFARQAAMPAKENQGKKIIKIFAPLREVFSIQNCSDLVSDELGRTPTRHHLLERLDVRCDPKRLCTDLLNRLHGTDDIL